MSSLSLSHDLQPPTRISETKRFSKNSGAATTRGNIYARHGTSCRCIETRTDKRVPRDIYSVGGRYKTVDRSQCWLGDFRDLTRASGNSTTIVGITRGHFHPRRGPVSMNLRRVTAHSNCQLSSLSTYMCELCEFQACILFNRLTA